MNLNHAQEAALHIQNVHPNFKPRVAIICGSGLGSLAEQLTDAKSISYQDLPGFPVSSVVGHAGQMVLGKLNNCPVVCMQGRPHVYEGVSDDAIKTYVRTLKLIGVEIFFATNASGSLREEVGPGSLVAINDHIHFQGRNPLLGPNEDEFGERFFPLDNTYDPALREVLHGCAKQLDLKLPEGVYISVLGPNYETAAEIRAFKMWGADVIGMSTIPEILVTKHCGMRCLIVSTITNYATGLTKVSHSHDAVVAAAQQASIQLIELIKSFCERIHDGI